MKIITIVRLTAAIFSASAYLPQAIKIIRTRKTSDISLLMYAVMGTGTVLWLFYGIFLNEWPLIIANSIGLILITTILIFKPKLSDLSVAIKRFT